MTTLDLSRLSWRLVGWRPYAWMSANTAEVGALARSEIGPVPARVPGSVQAALRKAGLLPDWNRGLNAPLTEWVEHRHWEFVADLPAGALPAGERVVLCADGLDHHGWIRVDGRDVAVFVGSLLRHRVDLTASLGDGGAHRLQIIFDTPPEEQGQVGFTAHSQHFKPRYNFSWDWCPRFVPIGISDALWLEAGEPSVEVVSLRTELAEDNRTGRVWLHVRCTVPTVVAVANARQTVPAGDHRLVLDARVKPWWPNGAGAQQLYDLRIGGTTFRVGFKRVRWRACEGAPDGATPWRCEVNGRDLFLQGVNWTPVRMDYHGVSAADYVHRVGLYRELGCNVLRVWGGAFLERAAFYEACDRAGLLVWQEFPLSSSGVDNAAPMDAAAIAAVAAIARDYVRRRRHHASLLMWCGGNELLDAQGRPQDATHPCLAALAQVVAEEDPGRRYVPTSPSGPSFAAHVRDYGQGQHHDVHGPWSLDGTPADWARYWAADDALFRSEVGIPGASSATLIRRYRGACAALPVARRNPYWQQLSAWWIQEELAAGRTLTSYVAASQRQQAHGLAVAARACKARFPRCGGILIWMGHDCFPCPVNTAIIDFEGNPKPAYGALKRVFRAAVTSRSTHHEQSRP